jgi:hypothetical protein
MNTLYYLDTEFIEDGKTIDLISIGIACEDGRNFYAESSEVDWDKSSEWVLQNVRPHLLGGDVVVPRASIASGLQYFVECGRHKPEFWAYYADYDWVAVCQLFGTMMQLPESWPKFCMDLKQLAVELGNPKLPKQESSEHHALMDALWNKSTHAWLQKYRDAGVV